MKRAIIAMNGFLAGVLFVTLVALTMNGGHL
jgi:hypothetical protein